MSRVMTRSTDRFDFRLLDQEAWDSPGRLSDVDIYTHAGPGWRRGDIALDDPEDEQ
jgi:hypothetical protein